MQYKLHIITSLYAFMICLLPVMQVRTSEESYSVLPVYEIASDASSDLCIDGTTASCKSSTYGENAVQITAEQYLQKQGFLWIWSTYEDAEWAETVDGSMLSVLNTISGLTSGKYRLKTVFTLTDKNGETEVIKTYSDEATVD